MARASLETLDKTLSKKYKEYSFKISKTGDEDSEFTIVPTDSVGMNNVFDTGGVPLGKLIVIKGPESSGKTALGFSLLGAVQRNIGLSGKLDQEGDKITYGNVALIDAERSYSQKWTERMGVSTDKSCFRVIHPPSGEIGLDFVEGLIQSGLYDAVLIDSLNALIPTAMIENEMGDATMGAQARMLSKAYGRIVGLADQYKTTIISISQERNSMSAYEKPVLAGGKATRFYNHIILDVRKKDFLGAKESPIGIRSRVKAEKNKCGRPFKTCEIDLFYSSGFNFMSDCINYAVDLGLIKQGGAWFTLSNGERFQGKQKVAEYYSKNEEEYDLLYKTVDQMLNHKEPDPEEDYEEVE